MSPHPHGPARSLNELYQTLTPYPLIEQQEFDLFYREDLTSVRGQDTVARLSRRLQQSYGSVPFRTFVMGHPGVGKSTEMTRLLIRVKDQHRGVRLSVAEELNPASFKIFDVLVLLMVRLFDEVNNFIEGGFTPLLSESLVQDIREWFEEEVVKRESKKSSSVEVGAGLRAFFASLKGEIKYAANRSTQTVEYRLRRLPELVEICNRLIDACNRSLWEKEHKEWLLVIEDLDKTGISPPQLQELFVQYGTVLQDLRVSMIFTIPVWLAYSPDANRLPFDLCMIPDTPVFDKLHEPHLAGRSAVEMILLARMSPDLFEEGQMMRLIVASGGNLRDLFALALDAGERALLRNSDAFAIAPEDTTAAIQAMRADYRRKLAQNPYDPKALTYEEKLPKMLAVYSRQPDHDISDPSLYSLLRARAIQEFNGEVWFGVHPLVVDILKAQQHLRPQDPGGTE